MKLSRRWSIIILVVLALVLSLTFLPYLRFQLLRRQYLSRFAGMPESDRSALNAAPARKVSIPPRYDPLAEAHACKLGKNTVFLSKSAFKPVAGGVEGKGNAFESADHLVEFRESAFQGRRYVTSLKPEQDFLEFWDLAPVLGRWFPGTAGSAGLTASARSVCISLSTMPVFSSCPGCAAGIWLLGRFLSVRGGFPLIGRDGMLTGRCLLKLSWSASASMGHAIRLPTGGTWGKRKAAAS